MTGTSTDGAATDGVTERATRPGPAAHVGVARTVTTIAALTLREAVRRRVVLALGALTVLLLALSSWGFWRLSVEPSMTTGETRLSASIVLNIVMFGFSLVAALGTAFLAGPTLAGETESGIALAVLARPVRRSAFLLGKWLGLVVFGSGYIVLAGAAQVLVVRVTVGYWPPQPALALALLALQAVVLLTLAVLLSTVISPMASGVVAVGLFGATWVAGVVAGLGAAFGNDSLARIGTVSRVLLPTEGLWSGVMHALQDPSVFLQFGGQDVMSFPFLSAVPLTPLYLAYTLAWVAVAWALAAASFRRRDL